MVIFTEGFDWSTNIADYTSTMKWGDLSTGIIANVTATLRFGSGSGNYYRITNNASTFLRRPIGQNLEAGVIGFAHRFATNVSNNYSANLLVLFDTISTVQMGLKLDTARTLSVFRDTHANILGTTATVLDPDAWYYIELKFKIANSIASGDVEVWIDGTLALTVTATSDTQATANAYVTHMCLGGNSPSVTSGHAGDRYYDDLYVCDLTGGINDDVLGNVRIQTRHPDGNGNSSMFVGSDGNSVNNYQQVDETAYNAADYNDGVNVDDKDTYSFDDTLPTTTVIKAVVLNIVALKTDSNPREIVPVVRHGGSEDDGPSITLSTNATTFQSIYDENPVSASGWTKSDVDAAEFGAKVSV